MEIPSWIECLKACAEQRPPMPRATKARLTAGHMGALYELRNRSRHTGRSADALERESVGDAGASDARRPRGGRAPLPCFFRKAPMAPAPASATDDIATLELEQDEERKMASVRSHLRAKARARFLQRRENWVLDAKDLSQVEGALATCIMPPPPPCPRTPSISPRSSAVETRNGNGGDDASSGDVASDRNPMHGEGFESPNWIQGVNSVPRAPATADASDDVGLAAGVESDTAGVAAGNGSPPAGVDRVGVVGGQQASPRAGTDMKDAEERDARDGEIPRNFSPSLEQFMATERFGGTADYMDFVRIRGLVPRKAGEYFSARNFLRFPRDVRGRISCHLFLKYVCDSVSLYKTKITLHFFDSRGLGHLTEHDLEHFVYDHIPTIGALQGIHEQFHTFYVISAVRRFMFFLDSKRTGKIEIDTMVRSRVMKEFIELRMAGGFDAGGVGTNGYPVKQVAAQATPAGYFEAVNGEIAGGRGEQEEERSSIGIEGPPALAEQGIALPPPTLRAPSPPAGSCAGANVFEGGGDGECGPSLGSADAAGVILEAGVCASGPPARSTNIVDDLREGNLGNGDEPSESWTKSGSANPTGKRGEEGGSRSESGSMVKGKGDLNGADEDKNHGTFSNKENDYRALDERRLQELEEAQWTGGVNNDEGYNGHGMPEPERRSGDSWSYPHATPGYSQHEERQQERRDEEQWIEGSIPSPERVPQMSSDGFVHVGAELPVRPESNDYADATAEPVEPPQPMLPVFAKDLSKNWFSAENISRVYTEYLELDMDENGLLSKAELVHFGARARTRLTTIFIERLFQEVLTYRVPAVSSLSSSSSSSHLLAVDRGTLGSVPPPDVSLGGSTDESQFHAQLQSQLQMAEERAMQGGNDPSIAPAPLPSTAVPNSPPRSPPVTPCPGSPTQNGYAMEGGVTLSPPFHPSLGHVPDTACSGAGRVDYGGGQGTVEEQKGVQREITQVGGGVLARRGRGQGEMDYKSFLDLVLATENRQTRQAMQYFWRVLDVNGTGYMTPSTINVFYRDVVTKLREGGCDAPSVEDVKDEIFDMVNPQDPAMITFADLMKSGNGPTVMSILTDANGFWAYDNRESLNRYDLEDDPTTANNPAYGLNFPAPPSLAPVPTSVAGPLPSAEQSPVMSVSDQPASDPESGSVQTSPWDVESPLSTLTFPLSQAVDVTPASGPSRPPTPDNRLAPLSVSAMTDGSSTAEQCSKDCDRDALAEDPRYPPLPPDSDSVVESRGHGGAASTWSLVSPGVDELRDSTEFSSADLVDAIVSKVEQGAIPGAGGGLFADDVPGVSSPGGHAAVTNGAAARAAARAVTAAVAEHARRVSPVLSSVMGEARLHRDPEMSNGDAILAPNVEVSI